MTIQTVYFNFDGGAVVTWFRPSAIDWDRVDSAIRDHYHHMSADLKRGKVWVLQFRHEAFRQCRWALVAGVDPDYSQTVFFLRRELGVAII